MGLISVVIPTVPGREQLLEQVKAAYAAHTTGYELIVLPGYKACGPAWQAGGDLATGDYLHFGADDLVPHEGWWEPAVKAVDAGFQPSPRLLWPDGKLQACGESWEQEEPDGALTGFSRVPFMSREQWQAVQPMLPCHYYTDNWISYKARLAGYETIVCHGYLFTHHSAEKGRLHTAGQDGNTYMRAVGGEDVWASVS